MEQVPHLVFLRVKKPSWLWAIMELCTADLEEQIEIVAPTWVVRLTMIPWVLDAAQLSTAPRIECDCVFVTLAHIVC
eukprot:1306709-Amphidinium_carterae.1